jgi:hypothetical protein
MPRRSRDAVKTPVPPSPGCGRSVRVGGLVIVDISFSLSDSAVGSRSRRGRSGRQPPRQPRCPARQLECLVVEARTTVTVLLSDRHGSGRRTGRTRQRPVTDSTVRRAASGAGRHGDVTAVATRGTVHAAPRRKTADWNPPAAPGLEPDDATQRRRRREQGPGVASKPPVDRQAGCPALLKMPSWSTG